MVIPDDDNADNDYNRTAIMMSVRILFIFLVKILFMILRK